MRFKWMIISSLISLKWHKRRFGKSVERLQQKRWNAMRSTLLMSPFYRPFVQKNEDFGSYPMMNKSLFMEHFDAINTKGIKKKEAFEIAMKAERTRDFSPTIKEITIGLSSGTSGNRGIFLASEKERAQWVACVLDRVIGFSLKHRKVAFFLRANSNLYDSVKSRVLQFGFFDLMLDMKDHISALNTLQPDILVAPASALQLLSKAVESGELNIKPSKIISVAEVLYPEDRVRLEHIFEQTIHQVYQCTEGMLAATCKHGTLHFNEDFIRIERKYIDDDQRRFHPVITDLIRSSQPVVRYELNDIVTEKHDCPCGSPFMAIEQIEGRSDDILTFTDVNGHPKHLFPDYFRRAIILASESITEYQVIQTDKNAISVYVNKSPETAVEAIRELLKGFEIEDITIITRDSLQQDRGSKLRRIRNDYQTA